MFWILFLLFLVVCGASATTGSMFQPGEWYRALDKPTWTPPNWVFPVTWTVLYLLISAAAARVAPLDGSGVALGLWAMQIAYNTLWTPIFFGLRRMRPALIIIGVLWLAVAATMVAFLRLDLWAGLMFVPYLVWVTIAGGLNASVLRRNPAYA
ncbi:TspO and MBR related proteins [Tranquillimonas rosea]|uniref:TspO and MBR related proteins n=1 Tax=Tranquillimonas rosea TaxID=641238 RepID=A0A1H9SKP8_9RHOB|nr:TspO/MBR family protein [Tranquillimonas rosea]SER85265.1 TspO and MBR related proteins [Tranquillimonas rosea]